MSLWFIEHYVYAMHRFRYLFLLAWVGIFIGCCFAAVRFPTNVTQEITPPRHSQAFAAREFAQDHFAGLVLTTGFAVYTKALERGMNVGTDPRFFNFDRAMEYAVKTGTLEFPAEGFPDPAHVKTVTKVSSYSSYRADAHLNMPTPVSLQYLSSGNGSAFSTISFSDDFSAKDTKEFSEFLEKCLRTLLARYQLTHVVDGAVFSLPNFLSEIAKSGMNDIIVLFGVALPISLIVFGYSLSSPRLVILPVVTLLVSLAVAFGMMDGVAVNRSVNSLAPGLCAAMTLAFGLNYSYFFAASYRKALVRSRDSMVVGVEDYTRNSIELGFGRYGADEVIGMELLEALAVITSAMCTSGRTIFISALTLCLCSVGLVFFKVELLQTVGVSVIVATGSAALVTLNLLPTLIVSFFHFFARSIDRCRMCTTGDDSSDEGGGDDDIDSHGQQQPQRGVTSSPPSSTNTADAAAAAAAASGGEAVEDSSAALMMLPSVIHATAKVAIHANTRYHYILVRFVTQKPWRYLFVIFALGFTAAFMTFAFDGKYSNDIEQFVPRDSSLLPLWDDMQRDFRAGEVFGYTLMMEVPPEMFPKSFTNATEAGEIYDVSQAIIWTMIKALPQTRAQNFDGPTFAGVLADDPALTKGGNISVASLKSCTGFNVFLPPCFYFYLIQKAFVASNSFPAIAFMVRLDFDPTSELGQDWYASAKELMLELEQRYDARLHLFGYGADTYDTVRYANKALPKIAAIVASVVFFMIAVAFFSITVPLKCLLTCTMTVGTCFGFSNLVHVHDDLKFLHFGGLRGNGSIAWQIPLSSFLISAAIALNFELITVMRVFMLRWNGSQRRVAVVRGLAETGREVSIAALIMFIIFSGLLFSEVPAMNELGLYCVVAAVVQGFVFRLTISPALMAMLGRWNFFPGENLQKFCKPIVISNDENTEDRFTAASRSSRLLLAAGASRSSHLDEASSGRIDQNQRTPRRQESYGTTHADSFNPRGGGGGGGGRGRQKQTEDTYTLL